MLEDEIKLQGKKLAVTAASESTLRAQNSLLQENSEKLHTALEEAVQARKAAEMLICEYEVGMENRSVSYRQRFDFC